MQVNELITTVGKKRFMILVVLLAVGGGLGAAWQKWFIPQHQALVSEKDSVQSDRMRLQTEIRELPAKYEVLQANERRYEALSAKGFLMDQDRIVARGNMDQLRVMTGVRGINYDISPQAVVEHSQSYALNMNIVQSQIRVDFKSLSDIEMREFVEKIQQNFSGLVVAGDFSLERGEDITEEALLRLSTKVPVDFAKGKATFTWYNIVPKLADPNSPEAQAFGGQSQ